MSKDGFSSTVDALQFDLIFIGWQRDVDGGEQVACCNDINLVLDMKQIIGQQAHVVGNILKEER